MNDPAPPARAPRPAPRGWGREAAAALVLAVLFEAVTAAARFGLGLQTARDTGFLARLTFGVRVHHGYVGVVLLLAAPLARVPTLRRWLAVLGAALVLSDLLHHFAVLWPVTGDPHWDWVYPDAAPAPAAPAGWLPDRSAAGWALWLAEWVVRFAALAVVPARRPPASATAWLLTIFLFPWPGLVLYTFIGSPRMPAWRRRKLAAFERATAPARERAAAATADRGAEVSGRFAPVARLSRHIGHLPATGGNAVELMADTAAVFARLAADIDAAAHHAHLFYYIAAADPATEPVLAALARAAGRGVKCRLVYDWQGSRRFAGGLRDRLAGTGVEVRAALPLKLFSRRGTRADLRNHRKITVIDGRVGYVGSLNLVDPGFLRGLVYEDLSARVTGPAVPQFQLVFASDWWLEADELLHDPAYYPPPGTPGTAVGQVLPSGPEFPTQNFQRVLVDVIHQAHREVTLVTPYLVPDDGLMQAFDTAARRGVRVRIVVSAAVDQRLVRLCQESYYAELLRAGVEVYQYAGGFLHTKLGVADGEFAVVGSCNADYRSFQLNAEVSLLLYDRETVAAASARADGYVAKSARLNAEAWAARPRWRRPVENLARIWGPLL